MEERFWSKVNKTDTCWLWTGNIDIQGYGRIGIDYKMKKAHQVSWLLAGNNIPEGLLIRHRCRSRNCVNPEHLETGTNAENMADKVRDASVKGVNNPRSKLTEAQVLDIRARATEYQDDLAKEFGVKQAHISSIILRKSWKHI